MTARKPALLLAAFLAVALALAWWPKRGPLSQRSAASVPAARVSLPIAAIVDSQRAAVTEKRWTESVEWARLLATREPNDPMHMHGLAMAWHNWAWASEGYGRARSATRTSLERVRMEKRALAILDSAVTFARTPEETALILHWTGQIYEIYGLPVEAAIGYQAALAASPGYDLSVPRATWVMKRLRDPLGNR